MFTCLGGCSSSDVSDNGPPYECEIEEAKAETKRSCWIVGHDCDVLES